MKIDPERIDQLAKLTVQSVVTGCTAMLNSSLVFGRKAIETGAEERTKPLLWRVMRPRKAGANAIQWEVGQRQTAALLRVHGAELAVEKCEMLSAFLRCETGESCFIRIATLIRHGFYEVWFLPNLVKVVNLWTNEGE
jgi:hypothetical protein